MKAAIKIFLAILLIWMAYACCKLADENAALESFIEQYVPDQRETLFNVSIDKTDGNMTLLGETDSESLKKKLLDEFAQYSPVDQITLLPDSSVEDETFGLIMISVANMRSEPSHSSELVTQGLMGMPVKILKKEDGWFLIQTPDKYISWVDSGSISPKTEQQMANWKKAKRIIVTREFQLVRVGEENNSAVVSDVTLGDILETVSENSNNMEVKLPDDRSGFISKNAYTDFDTFTEQGAPSGESLIKLAKSFMVRPYLWGGTSAKAMDCSGFVKTVYYMHGLILARDASLQARHGEMVSPSENFNTFAMGDLLFFGSSPDRITHVALSLGSDEYIHASGRVKENSFDPGKDNYSEYREKSFISCRRIIGMEDTEGIISIKNHPWYR